jgi:hypothetical protein
MRVGTGLRSLSFDSVLLLGLGLDLLVMMNIDWVGLFLFLILSILISSQESM